MIRYCVLCGAALRARFVCVLCACDNNGSLVILIDDFFKQKDQAMYLYFFIYC